MTRRRWIADKFTDTTASLTGDQALHLARVLRAQPGQIFDVVANGFLRRATVVNVSEQEVAFALGEELEAEAALPVHLLLAIIKFDHYEWGLEKLTELGAARITPVIARRTEKHLAHASAKRVERWRRIALEAAKQSRRSDLPQVDDPLPLKQAIAQITAPTKLLLAETEQENSLAAAVKGCNGSDRAGDRPGRRMDTRGDDAVQRERVEARHARPADSARRDGGDCGAKYLLGATVDAKKRPNSPAASIA